MKGGTCDTVNLAHQLHAGSKTFDAKAILGKQECCNAKPLRVFLTLWGEAAAKKFPAF